MRTKTTYIAECDGKEFEKEDACLAHEQDYARNLNRNRVFAQNLSLDLINLICPTHNRTSCSDTNANNGFYDYGPNDQLRCDCDRCGLLEILRDKDWMDMHRFEFKFSLSGF